MNGSERPPEVPRRDGSFQDQPFIVMVTSHWVSMLGLFLVGSGLITWLFVLPLETRGHAANPYIGILIFMVVPIIFVLGLALVPVGVWLARRRVRQRLEVQITDRRVAVQRLLTFLGLTTAVNVLVGTQLTYRAVEHMESVQFCGQTCHVMKPEFMAHQSSSHAQLACVECHVGPGFQGWAQSKMAGTRQLIEVVLGTYPRPVPPALESDRLVPARQTCEQCHWTEQFAAAKLRVVAKFAEDEANTETQTVLMMMVGGSRSGGIHGKHFGPGIEIRYAPADKERQTIPWVEYRDTAAGKTSTYVAKGAKPEEVAKLTRYAMQCVDCHNRPTHAFDLPDRAVDKALAGGFLPATLPYIKKESVQLLKVEYPSSEEASRRIPAELRAYYKSTYPEVVAKRGADIESAGKQLVEIYNRNVFPELKVAWGTYRNNLGHDAFPGCFRCHDEDHSTAGGQTITQDCSACHELVSTDEASPEVLKTLGLAERIAAIKKR